MSKINDVVSWVMKEDKILKLQKADKTYDISDEVAKFLDGKGLFDKLEDQAVEVEIDESKGQDGTITRLTLSGNKEESKSEPEKAEEPKTEQSVNSDYVTKEMTVAGVSVKNAGVTFKEEDKVWYTLDSTVDAQKFKDECTKKTIEVTIASQDKGNDVIKGYVLKEEEKTDKEKDTDEPSMTGKDAFYRVKQLENQVRYLREEKAESFEAQASVNSANQAVSGMTNIHDDPEKVLNVIERIAIKNFAVIQKLKTKKE